MLRRWMNLPAALALGLSCAALGPLPAGFAADPDWSEYDRDTLLRTIAYFEQRIDSLDRQLKQVETATDRQKADLAALQDELAKLRRRLPSADGPDGPEVPLEPDEPLPPLDPEELTPVDTVIGVVGPQERHEPEASRAFAALAIPQLAPGQRLTSGTNDQPDALLTDAYEGGRSWWTDPGDPNCYELPIGSRAVPWGPASKTFSPRLRGFMQTTIDPDPTDGVEELHYTRPDREPFTDAMYRFINRELVSATFAVAELERDEAMAMLRDLKAEAPDLRWRHDVEWKPGTPENERTNPDEGVDERLCTLRWERAAGITRIRLELDREEGLKYRIRETLEWIRIYDPQRRTGP